MKTRIETYRALATTYQSENDKARLALDDTRATIASLEAQLKTARIKEAEQMRELERGRAELRGVRAIIRTIEDAEIAAEQERQAAEREARRVQEDFTDEV
jgi:chromosome segregation ATPase